jgi:DNA-binding beta-propeller fold protein YncE
MHSTSMRAGDRAVQSRGLRRILPAVLALGAVCTLPVALGHGVARPDGDPLTQVNSLVAGLSAGLFAGSPDPSWTARAESSFFAFESGQVRPLALSADGRLLFATNTPDNRLEVFRVTGGGLQHRASIAVGLEPVAVALRDDRRIWVVNHLSDSVSVVDYDDALGAGRVVRTLAVGDEPRDIVFAGPNRSRAFITTAHRGQNHPVDPQLTTPGVGRADVWVYDADALGPDLNGSPLAILNFFTDTPRALAVSPDGGRVYVAGFHTGNRTTTVFHFLVPTLELLTPKPMPLTNYQGIPAPDHGVIVKHDGQHWVDSAGGQHDVLVKFDLPDKDVFTIDAQSSPPREIPGGTYRGVGTSLFNMAVNPVSGALYVSNTEANNLNRFEGPGRFAGHSIRGNLVQSRISVLRQGTVTPRHLNKHIDYSAAPAATPNAVSVRSLAFPQEMAVSRDGGTLYVAALGSSKVGVFDTAALEEDRFVPDASMHVKLSAGGPTGLVLDESRERLYVLTRYDNGISIVDTRSRSQIGHLRMYNPEPASIVKGRPLLYEAAQTSGFGDSACASCHVYGDMDQLAWDLGNPDGEMLANPGPFRAAALGSIDIPLIPGGPLGLALPASAVNFHPMKGPMTTQSLRGMANHGPMHWRADRTGGNDEASAQPDSGSFDEMAAFRSFNGAFVELMGRDRALSAADMQAFADFALELVYPPNPIRALDNSLTPTQQRGKDAFFNFPLADGPDKCIDCHKFDPSANAGATKFPGFFGSDGANGFVTESQPLKVAHFRNLYQKVGRFGFAFNALDVDYGVPPTPDNQHMGEQIRGFGFLHDGGYDTISRFITNAGFNNPHLIFNKDAGGREIEAYLLAFDSNLSPIVGQQATYSAATKDSVGPRIGLLRARADRRECDLVARLTQARSELGYLYRSGLFHPAQQGAAARSDAQLRSAALSAQGEVTYTCVPPGSGTRIALDRDLDGVYDQDELLRGTRPADPFSH